MRIVPISAIALLFQLANPQCAFASGVDRDKNQLPTDRTYLTFPCATRVPGATLAAGTYLFVVVEAVGGQALIDVYASDASAHLARFLGVERPYAFVRPPRTGCPAAPDVRRGWFHGPGTLGYEFVFEQREASDLALTEGLQLPHTPLRVHDPDLVGAYPVAGLSMPSPLLIFGAGSAIAIPSETSTLGRLVAAAGASFGPLDHLTAARIIVSERAARVPREETLLLQLESLVAAIQSTARKGDAIATERLVRGFEATLLNLRPPTEVLARRGILPPPRDFQLTLEQLGAHVRAFARRAPQ